MGIARQIRLLRNVYQYYVEKVYCINGPVAQSGKRGWLRMHSPNCRRNQQVAGSNPVGPDMEITEKELQDTFSKLRIPKDIRLFMITKNMYVRIYKGKVNWRLLEEEFEFVRKMKCERGEILDLFSKMEVMVNELIQLNLLGANAKEAEKLDDLLAYVDFFSRLRILGKWGILDNKTVEMLNQAKQVRNGFAHAWGVEEVLYKEKPIGQNFEVFKKDMEQIWKELVGAYSVEQKRYDIPGIFQRIREYNEK